MVDPAVSKFLAGFSRATPRVDDATRRSIYSYKRNPVIVLLLGVFLLIFSAPYFFVGPMLETFDADDLYGVFSMVVMFSFLTVWTVVVLATVLRFLALILGREVVDFNPGSLSVRVELFGAGFTRIYRGEQVKNLQWLDPLQDSAESWRGPHMRFDYEETQVAFGVAINQSKAAEFVEEFQEVTLSATLPDETPPIEIGQVEEPDLGSGTVARDSASLAALVIANLVPLAGVIALDWSVGQIMLIFWLESGVIGIFNLAKLWMVVRWFALIAGLFFAGHYGAFMAAHLLFLTSFFLDGDAGVMSLSDFVADWQFALPAVIALFISHGVSFVVNFVRHREYERKTVVHLMTEPYSRIMVMQLTIICGGMLTMVFSNPLPALVLMIVLKMAVDLKAHIKEHADSELSVEGGIR